MQGSSFNFFKKLMLTYVAFRFCSYNSIYTMMQHNLSLSNCPLPKHSISIQYGSDEIRVHLIIHHYVTSSISSGTFIKLSRMQPRALKPCPLFKEVRSQILAPFRSLCCTEQVYDSFMFYNPSSK